jgi:hypothetical protein
MDTIRPACPKQVRDRKAHQYISDRWRIEDACIKEGDKSHSGRVLRVFTHRLGFRDKPIQTLPLIYFHTFPVFEQIGKKHAAMRTNHVVSYLPPIDQFDDPWPGDPQKIGGLLSG